MIQGDGKTGTLIFHRRRAAQRDGKMRPRGARSPSADHHAGVQDPGARVSSGVNTIRRRRGSELHPEEEEAAHLPGTWRTRTRPPAGTSC